MARAGFKGQRCATCCEDSCVIGEDLFDGTLSGWTEESGTWAIDDGLLEGTGAGSIIFDTAVPSLDTAYRAYTGALNTSADGTVRLKVCWSDANNYLFGEFAISGSGAVLILGQVVGGSSSSFGDGIVVDDTGAELDARSTLCLEFNPGPVQEAQSFFVGNDATMYVTSPDDPGVDEWANPGNILSQDDTPGTYDFPSSPTTASARVSTFNFAPPPGSTIDGVIVHLRALGTQNSGGFFPTIESVRLVTDMFVGDDKGPAGPVAATYGDFTFGSPTDDWNAGLTWEDVSSGAFGVEISFDGESNQLSVDVIEIEIHYTTPTRRPGRLRFSRTNTGAPQNSQCVTEYAAENPAGGLKTGIGIIAGDWNFDAWHVEHHQADRAECDVCECTVAEVPCDGCCDQAFMPAESHVVDLGEGGWVGGCEACEEVEGVFILEPIGECGWGYLEPKNCNAGVCGTGNLHIVLFLMGETPDCFWRLVVSMNFQSSSPGNDCTVEATYESETLADDEACQAMPVTLTKVSDPGSLQCGGALPATVTLDVA